MTFHRILLLIDVYQIASCSHGKGLKHKTFISIFLMIRNCTLSMKVQIAVMGRALMGRTWNTRLLFRFFWWFVTAHFPWKFKLLHGKGSHGKDLKHKTFISVFLMIRNCTLSMKVQIAPWEGLSWEGLETQDFYFDFSDDS